MLCSQASMCCQLKRRVVAGALQLAGNSKPCTFVILKHPAYCPDPRPGWVVDHSPSTPVSQNNRYRSFIIFAAGLLKCWRAAKEDLRNQNHQVGPSCAWNCQNNCLVWSNKINRQAGNSNYNGTQPRFFCVQSGIPTGGTECFCYKVLTVDVWGLICWASVADRVCDCYRD